MSDVVGAASVVVTPEVSSFASDLTAAIAPGLAAAQSQATTGGADVGKALSDGVASGFTLDAGGRIRDEFGKFVSQSDLAGSEAGRAFAASVGQPIEEGAAKAADSAKTSLGNAAQETASIWQQVAIGNIIADGVEAGVAIAVDALKTLVSAVPNIGSEIQGAFNVIRTSTGDTGQALDSLKGSFDAVAKVRGDSLENVGQTIAVLNQRLDLTGPNLEAVSVAVLRLSSFTGTDLESNLQGLTGAFNNFNISADKQAGKVDELFRVYQKTGVPVTELESSLSKLGAVARLAGLSFEDTASLIGQLNKAGLDGSTVQRAFTKILKDSAEKGIDAKVGFKQTFDAIKSGTMSVKDGFDLFGPRAVQVFELIKEGKLDYEGLSKAISTGGDTLANAADDTKTWQYQLKILANTLKVAVEPVAVFVFGKLTDAAVALRPVIAGIAGFVVEKLAPGFQALAVTLKPVWDFFDKARIGIKSFMDTVASGGTVLDGLGSFFTDLLGTDAAQKIVDGLLGIGAAFTTVWTTLQPIRDAIASAFFTIKDAIGKFVSDHSDVVLAGLAGTITAVVVPAVIALGGVLLGLVLSLVSPIVLVGVLAGALYYAYTQSETFRTSVDQTVASLINFYNWLSNDGSWNDFRQGWSGLADGIRFIKDEILDPLIGSIQTLYNWLSNDGSWNDFRQGWSGLADGIRFIKDEVLDPLIGSIQDLYNWLSNNGSWDDFRKGWQGLADGIRFIKDSVLDPLIGTIQTLIDKITGLADNQFVKALTGGGTTGDNPNGVSAGDIISKLMKGGFAEGGIVPGPMGQAQLAVVHGGETVIPSYSSGAMDRFMGSMGAMQPFAAVPSDGGGSAAPIVINVSVPSGTMNPEVFGRSVGDAAGDAFVRRTNIKTAVRTSPSSAR